MGGGLGSVFRFLPPGSDFPGFSFSGRMPERPRILALPFQENAPNAINAILLAIIGAF